MKLQFNAVGQLTMAIVCPSCGKTGKDTEFAECCFEYMLELLGIQGREGGEGGKERSDAPLNR